MTSAQQEIQHGVRFAFGANWIDFLRQLNESRIRIAEESLKTLLQDEELQGKRFLDIGSGSGLFSLCARRLGAIVLSFDYDPQSAACTEELRTRFFPDDPQWSFGVASILDERYVRSLGTFDVVYSWGVLHHTGQMWQALQNTHLLCRPGGKLAIAIYNDQGVRSQLWRIVKRIYCSGKVGRWSMLILFIPYFFLRTLGVSILRRQNEFRQYRRHRGMSIMHDWIDWLGGYPYEVASVDAITAFYAERGYRLIQLKKTRRLGCNEFVFIREKLA